MRRRATSCATIAAVIALALLPAAAAPPGEVAGLSVGAGDELTWAATAGADVYHVYRGIASELVTGIPPRCHGTRVAGTSFLSPADPAAGEAYVYLVTAASAAGEEGTAGAESGGAPRAVLGHCEPVMRHHLLSRLAYGWSEWDRDRIDALGWQGYLDEQLAPETIDETSNTLLTTREARYNPPTTYVDLVYLRQDRSLYARRQLQRQVTEFWHNHFTTYYFKTFEFLFGRLLGNIDKTQVAANDLHLREENRFRVVAFNGTFRDILEESALSPAMMIYLDNVVNVAGIPNENYARELLELHTLGVDGGYTQQDVEELARVFTGWEVCKKPTAVAGDPLAACTDPVFGLPGRWTIHFNVANHDSGQKVLFAGTPQETVIPDTSSNPVGGIDDVGLALDALATHPSTARYISKKLLRRFVVDQPPAAMIDAVVLEWTATGGNLREVLRAVLDPQNLFDPELAGAKVRSPQEHLYAAYRALRGKTQIVLTGYNNALLYNWLAAMDHLPYNRVAPDGYPETGPPWIGTNQLLTRQDMGLGFAYDPFLYRTEVAQMVAEYGLDTSEKIVDFFADVLYGGAITPAERQRALTYLTTDDTGAPAPYNDDRIRQTVGFMLGFAQFNER